MNYETFSTSALLKLLGRNRRDDWRIEQELAKRRAEGRGGQRAEDRETLALPLVFTGEELRSGDRTEEDPEPTGEVCFGLGKRRATE